MAQDQNRSQYAWPAAEDRQVIGRRISRIDGMQKATGAAKYSSDQNPEGLLHAKVLYSPHAHATVTKLDVEPAKRVAGYRTMFAFPEGKEGAELQFEGQPILAIAADTPEQAQDCVDAVKIEYEVLDHWVDDEDIEGAPAERLARPQERDAGDPDAAFAEAEVTVEGYYGIPTIGHCCWETHGSTCVWDGKNLTAYLSTQAVSGTAGQFTGRLNMMDDVEVESSEVICHYIGGGFGSKFAADPWDIAAAYMANKTGRPVKLMLSRSAELQIAGNRPSGFAKIKVGAKKDGTLTAWESEHWGTGGVSYGTVNTGVMPYVFVAPNVRSRGTRISTNCGNGRAWRAPNHPQGCAMSLTALDDLAAELGMGSYEFFHKNLGLTDSIAHPNTRSKVYAAEMEIAADLMGWRAKWHPRGQGGPGPVKQGLGMAFHTWGGNAHPSSCLLKVHPDGGVETFLGSQDLGTGTKTVIAAVIAETFGLAVSAVKVNVGRSSYPTSGGSGGSTTVGGVSGSNRKAAVDARGQLFAKVAPKLDAQPGDLEAIGGRIRVKGHPDRSLSWKQATALLGVSPIEVQARHRGGEAGLTSGQVGGVQMADVSVDTETGVVRMNKFVAVQDVGTIIDLLTAESQVYGAAIMGIAYALSEERIMDNATGRFINADMVNYKLPRLGDIGEIVVHMIQPDDGEVGAAEHARGVVGLGEPPVISPGAAISNAVANAIGARVPTLPLTPEKVLTALRKGGNA